MVVLRQTAILESPLESKFPGKKKPIKSTTKLRDFIKLKKKKHSCLKKFY